MSWNKEGQAISANYLGIMPVTGLVQSSRVKYGGSVQHTVKLDTSINIYGAERTTLLIDDTEVTVVNTN